MDDEAASLMAYQTGNAAAECCDENDETSNGWSGGDTTANGWSGGDATANGDWSRSSWPSKIPDYDLAAAMSIPGQLIDTHFHLDFICRRLRNQVTIDNGCLQNLKKCNP